MGFIVVQHHNIQLVSNNEVFTALQSSPLTKGLGKMERKLHLEVNESVPPVIMPPRRVPVALKEKFKEDIDRLVSVGVLEKVEEPTKWVSSAVVTAKSNGKVRVCIDPRPLNEALSRSHYPLPVIDDILPGLGKARVVSKADLKDGFLQIELDDESRADIGGYECLMGSALHLNTFIYTGKIENLHPCKNHVKIM